MGLFFIVKGYDIMPGMINGTEILGKLFSSPARVRILRLFLLNSEQGFESKDISIKTKTQISVVRKELSLLSHIGFIKKKLFTKEIVIPSKKKKLPPKIKYKKIQGWFLNTSFQYLEQFRSLLSDPDFFDRAALVSRFRNAGKLKLLIVSGVFIQDPESRADLLVVGDKLKKGIIDDAIRTIEAEVGRELSYAVFTTAEFLYRAEMYDKLICDMLEFPHETLIDTAQLSTRILRKP